MYIVKDLYEKINPFVNSNPVNVDDLFRKDSLTKPNVPTASMYSDEEPEVSPSNYAELMQLFDNQLVTVKDDKSDDK